MHVYPPGVCVRPEVLLGCRACDAPEPAPAPVPRVSNREEVAGVDPSTRVPECVTRSGWFACRLAGDPGEGGAGAERSRPDSVPGWRPRAGDSAVRRSDRAVAAGARGAAS